METVFGTLFIGWSGHHVRRLFTEHLTLTSWGYVMVGALVIGMILKVGRSL